MRWDRICGFSTTSPTISRRCGRRLARQNIELNVQAISADELVRRQLMEAEHFNDAVDEYVDDDTEEDEARAEADAKAELNRVRGHIERAEEYF